MILSDLLHRVAVAEGGCKNKLITLCNQIADDTLRIGTLGHFFNKTSFYFFSKLFFNGFARGVVRESPTCITHWSHVNEAYLQGLGFWRFGLGCLLCSFLRFLFLATRNHERACRKRKHRKTSTHP